MPSVAAVIVSYNTREKLHRCLLALRDPSIDVIVIDCESGDGSAEMVARDVSWATLITVPNRGFGAAANAGVHACSADVVVVLNADAVATPGALAELEDHLASHPEAAAAGPRLLNEDGSPQRSVYPFLTPIAFLASVTYLGVLSERLAARRAALAGAVDWVKGAAVAYRREPFLAACGFDESYFLYFEEQDLCYRLRRAGWEVHYVPTATVVHSGEASIGQRREQATREFFRSAALFYEKHYGSRALRRLRAVLALVAAARLVRDGVLAAAVREPERRARLRDDRRVWRDLLGKSVSGRLTAL